MSSSVPDEHETGCKDDHKRELVLPGGELQVGEVVSIHPRVDVDQGPEDGQPGLPVLAASEDDVRQACHQ